MYQPRSSPPLRSRARARSVNLYPDSAVVCFGSIAQELFSNVTGVHRWCASTEKSMESSLLI